MSQKSKKNEERENTLDKSSLMHTVRECSLFYELGMHHSDRELVLAFQAGKYHCFETLYERALPKVYRYLLFKTNGNKTLAQDLCSETFLAGFEGLGSFQADENCNFWAWILRIAHHKFVDHIRARQEEQLSLNEELIVTGEDQLLQSLDLSMQAWVFLDFLETLGEEKKDIVVMRIWEDLSYQEIAQVLGKSEEACRQLFSRTMKALCDHFKS